MYFSTVKVTSPTSVFSWSVPLYIGKDVMLVNFYPKRSKDNLAHPNANAGVRINCLVVPV